MAEDERAQRYKDHLAFMDFRLEQRPALFERKPSDPLRPPYSMHAASSVAREPAQRQPLSEADFAATLEEAPLEDVYSSDGGLMHPSLGAVEQATAADSLDDSLDDGRPDLAAAGAGDGLADETFDTWSVSTPETPSVASGFIRAYMYQAQHAEPLASQEPLASEAADLWQPQLLLEVSELESEPRLAAPQAYVP